MIKLLIKLMLGKYICYSNIFSISGNALDDLKIKDVCRWYYRNFEQHQSCLYLKKDI